MNSLKGLALAGHGQLNRHNHGKHDAQYTPCLHELLAYRFPKASLGSSLMGLGNCTSIYHLWHPIVREVFAHNFHCKLGPIVACLNDVHRLNVSLIGLSLAGIWLEIRHRFGQMGRLCPLEGPHQLPRRRSSQL